MGVTGSIREKIMSGKALYGSVDRRRNRRHVGETREWPSEKRAWQVKEPLVWVLGVEGRR